MVLRAEPHEGGEGGGGGISSPVSSSHISMKPARTRLRLRPTTTQYEQKTDRNVGCRNGAHNWQNHEEEAKLSYVAGILAASALQTRVDRSVVGKV